MKHGINEYLQYNLVLHTLQQAFHAKDKNVQYHILFTLLQMIAHLRSQYILLVLAEHSTVPQYIVA